MKKIMICLLSLGVIAGCAQQPIVETDLPSVTEWLPEETANISVLDSFSLKPFEGDENAKKMIELMTYEDGSEFENWYNTFYFMETTVLDIHINTDSDDIKNLNSLLHDKYVNKKDIVGYPILDYRSFNDSQILSLVLKEGSYILTDHNAEHYIYNINIKSGELINNSELLILYDYTIENVKKSMKTYYDSHITDCVETETSGNCRTHYELINSENINEYSMLQMESDLYIIAYLKRDRGLVSRVTIKINK